MEQHFPQPFAPFVLVDAKGSKALLRPIVTPVERKADDPPVRVDRKEALVEGETARDRLADRPAAQSGLNFSPANAMSSLSVDQESVSNRYPSACRLAAVRRASSG